MKKTNKTKRDRQHAEETPTRTDVSAEELAQVVGGLHSGEVFVSRRPKLKGYQEGSE